MRYDALHLSCILLRIYELGRGVNTAWCICEAMPPRARKYADVQVNNILNTITIMPWTTTVMQSSGSFLPLAPHRICLQHTCEQTFRLA